MKLELKKVNADYSSTKNKINEFFNQIIFECINNIPDGSSIHVIDVWNYLHDMININNENFENTLNDNEKIILNKYTMKRLIRGAYDFKAFPMYLKNNEFRLENVTGLE